MVSVVVFFTWRMFKAYDGLRTKRPANVVAPARQRSETQAYRGILYVGLLSVCICGRVILPNPTETTAVNIQYSTLALETSTVVLCDLVVVGNRGCLCKSGDSSYCHS